MLGEFTFAGDGPSADQDGGGAGGDDVRRSADTEAIVPHAGDRETFDKHQ